MTHSSTLPDEPTAPTVDSVLAAETSAALPAHESSPPRNAAPVSLETNGPYPVSVWLAAIALIGLAGCYLLISPDPAYEQTKPWPAGSWLQYVVRAQALGYVFPTPNGVEIKDLVFYLGATVLSLLGAAACLLGRAELPRPAQPLRSPVLWFAVVVVISVVSAILSASPRAAAGGTVIRFLWLAWWWPLALCLTPRHARSLTVGLVAVATATALISLRHRAVRAPGVPLAYPMGNKLFLAACLLPAFMISATFAVALLWPRLTRLLTPRTSSPAADSTGPSDWAIGGAWLVPATILGAACILTGSRSALLGCTFGLLAMVYLAADREMRNWLAIVAAVVVGFFGGVVLIFGSDVSGSIAAVMDWLTGRSESIRARVEHEWPFAWHIFKQHPWLGAGEGGFSRLVGPLVRVRQFADPMLLNADNRFWESQAHNEVLETMSSLGLAGTLPLLIAIFITLRAARRAVDTLPSRPRLWIIALTGAFVGICSEELTDIALRWPGLLPASALTIWACLWALTRGFATFGHTPDAAPNPGRLSGIRVAACCMTLAVTTFAAGLALYDASAIRAQFQAAAYSKLPRPGEREAAIPLADRAVRWRLEPARYLNALVLAIQYRVSAAQPLFESTDPADLEHARTLCHETLQLIERLDATAPRYLHAREMEGIAATLLAQSAVQRGDAAAQSAYARQAALAFRRFREDEPFRINAIEFAWRTNSDAPVIERVRWLRDYLRVGEMPPRWDVLLESLGAQLGTVIDPIIKAAMADLNVPPDKWRDALAPESLRLAARVAFLSGQSAAAYELAKNAVTMYSQIAQGRAGNKLAAAHGAALYEQVQYAFDQIGFGMNWALQHQLLDTLDRAQRIALRTDVVMPIAGSIGRTRLAIMLSLGDQTNANPTGCSIAGKQDVEPVAKVFSQTYLDLITRFGNRATTNRDTEFVLEWARRAALLNPREPTGHRFTAIAALKLGQVEMAREAIRQYRRTEPRTEIVEADLAKLRQQFPRSAVWGGASSGPATQPATQSAPATLP